MHCLWHRIMVPPLLDLELRQVFPEERHPQGADQPRLVHLRDAKPALGCLLIVPHETQPPKRSLELLFDLALCTPLHQPRHHLPPNCRTLQIHAHRRYALVHSLHCQHRLTAGPYFAAGPELRQALRGSVELGCGGYCFLRGNGN